MKHILVISILICIVSCSNDGDTPLSYEEMCNLEPENRDVIIDTNDTYESHELRIKYNVYVTASRTSVRLVDGSLVGILKIEGDNNLITFEPNVSVDYLCTSGSDNTLSVPVNSGISIGFDSGTGNTVVEY